MNFLKVTSLYSPDLNDNINELPEDLTCFEVLIGASIKHSSWKSSQLFYFTVISADRLAEKKDQTFITQTLVIKKFDFQEIQKRIEKLIFPIRDNDNLAEVIDYLSPYIGYAK